MLILPTFDESVDFAESTDQAVPAVSLTYVNLGGKQAVAWLRVDQGDTYCRLQSQRQNLNPSSDNKPISTCLAKKKQNKDKTQSKYASGGN